MNVMPLVVIPVSHFLIPCSQC